MRGADPAKKLAEKPDRVRSLGRYGGMVRDLLSAGLLFEPLQRGDFPVATEISRRSGLPTDDALLAAVRERLGIRDVASADTRFLRVEEITLYSPDDLDL